MASAILLLASACGGGGEGPTEPAVARISIAPDSVWLTSGGTQQLAASLFNASGTQTFGTTTWQSDNESVARVSAGGMLTAVGPGRAVITGSAGGASALAVVRVGLSGTFSLRLMNGAAVPGVVPAPMNCPSGTDPIQGRVQAYSGALAFSNPNLVLLTMDVLFQCQSGSSRPYSGTNPGPYTVKDGVVTFGGDPFIHDFDVTALIKGDSLILKWKPNVQLRDTTTLHFVKQ